MRKAFDRQRRLDCPSVNKVPLNLRCRHEIVPILHALQHIYSRPQVRDRILHAIARDVNGESNARRGRPGLDYWEILVLAAARLGCNCDYDELQDLAENHRVLRQVMGIGDWSNAEDEEGKTRFDWRRIRDNVTRLRPETIARINEVIVQEGHRLEPIAAETVRGDSFVAATDVHFPTDNSLLRDGLRKSSAWRRRSPSASASSAGGNTNTSTERPGSSAAPSNASPPAKETITASGSRSPSSRTTPSCRATKAIATRPSARCARPSAATAAAFAGRRWTAAFTAPKTRRNWPGSSRILVCRCPASINCASKSGRPASNSAPPGSRTRELNRRSGPCSRTTAWSVAAIGRSGDSPATSDWACWAGIFTCWAKC